MKQTRKPARRSPQLLAAVLLALPGLALANADLKSKMDNPGNWAAQAGDFYNQRYSKLDQINKDNVGNMQVAWTFSTGVLRGHEGSPLVIDGMMYIHTPFPNKVFALDLDTQKIVWRYEPKQDPSVIAQMCCDTVYRGLAYAEGKIFLQQADTTLVALDAKTGKIKWQFNPEPPPGTPAPAPGTRGGWRGNILSAAPSIIDGAVVSAALNGAVYVNDARTGKLLWSFETAREFDGINGVKGKGGMPEDFELENNGLNVLKCTVRNGVETLSTYDSDDHLRSDGGTTYSYDAAGNVLSIAYANGVTTTYTYSATRGWLMRRPLRGRGRSRPTGRRDVPGPPIPAAGCRG